MNNNLQVEINNIDNLNDINQLNNLMKKCALVYEMKAVVFVYDYIKNNNITTNDNTFKILNTLHSKNITENKNLIIVDNKKNKLPARRRIHKIMKGYNYSKALKNKDIVINYLNNNKYYYNGKDKKQESILINLLKKELNLSVADIKFIIIYLKRTKYFIKKIDN